ncbi:putative bifunctional diguanylate cyclase/phosphodiesterase [Altererythrobacter sp. MF3-039]|uniref:putative bifunctional diguanylate cyclase/phosphodiesterase n=1 Tax=Altererythrobacter sp. MF3-039 TaxID=3252901 RepID=UPI00390CD7E7
MLSITRNFPGLRVKEVKAWDGVADPRLALFNDFEESELAWFWATDTESRVSYISPQIAKVLGKDMVEIVGHPFESLFDYEAMGSDSDCPKSHQGRSLKFLLRAKNTFIDREVRADFESREIWWSISGRPQFDRKGRFKGYLGNGQDVTSARRDRAEADRNSNFDSLTGLSNRRRMAAQLDSTIKAYKVSKRSCALMMLDLDRFKHINDTLGHPAGDELLKQAAQRLIRIVDDKGEIGRLGGDEFQIILPDWDDRGDLGELANRIIQMLSQPYSIEGTSCSIGASVGIAIAPYDGVDVDELVRNTDLGLYAAKEAGRGQFRFYSSDLHSKAEERRLVEDDLRDALHRGELKVCYQPLVCPIENRVKAFEALMRWNHPEHGAISPELFISVAEETGLIIKLGEWALRQACKDAAKWPGDIRVAVNVSPVQFMNKKLPKMVANALTASGLRPGRLELEITESVFIGDTEGTTKMFEALKKIGVRMALDDFGTGYSSLGYLRDAPFDKIKIDQSFIRGAVDNTVRGNAAIITAIVSLANSLDMDTTAEGIEAMDELDFVREQGVTTVQGFVYGKAAAQEDVLTMVQEAEIVLSPEGPAKTRSDRKSILRRIGLIHEDHRYEVMMRNLSQSGARVEGILDVPIGTHFVVDFGEGQLVVAEVKRSEGSWQGIEFEHPLISDGGKGWCTRSRISPYALAAAGMPLAALPPGAYPLVGKDIELDPVKISIPKFSQLDLAS